MGPKREWLFDGLLGVLVGGVVAAIVAVNFVIFSGMERGYESTIPEIFRQNVLVGIITVAILAAGPILGVWMMRRRRRRKVYRLTRPLGITPTPTGNTRSDRSVPCRG